MVDLSSSLCQRLPGRVPIEIVIYHDLSLFCRQLKPLIENGFIPECVSLPNGDVFMGKHLRRTMTSLWDEAMDQIGMQKNDKKRGVAQHG